MKNKEVKTEKKHFIYKGLTFKDDEKKLIMEWEGWNKSVMGIDDSPQLTFDEWIMMEDNWDAELLSIN